MPRRVNRRMHPLPFQPLRTPLPLEIVSRVNNAAAQSRENENPGSTSTLTSRRITSVAKRAESSLESIDSPSPLAKVTSRITPQVKRSRKDSPSTPSPLSERNQESPEYHPLDAPRRLVQNKEWERGLAALRSLTKISPLFVEAFLLEAQCYAALDRYDHALNSLSAISTSLTRENDIVLARQLSFDLYFKRGRARAETNPLSALSDLSQAYNIQPQNLDLLLFYGATLASLSSHEQANRLYIEALTHFPNHPLVLQRLS